MAGHHTIDIMKENRHLGSLAGKVLAPAAVIGLACLGVAVAMGLGGDKEVKSRFFQGYLVAVVFGTGISLGALFFTLIHHLTRAGWSTVVRRIAELLACCSLLMAVLWLPLIWALRSPDIHLWDWATTMADDPLVKHKAGYLNETFFLIRAAIYFIIWIVLSQFFYRLSVRQDETGDVNLSRKMQKVAAPGIILFALTLTFAAFDWLMSQDPHWFSTIFGVYYFAGSVCSFVALAILISAFLQRSGRLTHAITTEHYHDLGKLLFAFGVVFWAYIAFSQYMLQWYGNIPEETLWWQPRASGYTGTVVYHGHEITPGAWNNWSLFLLVGHFVGPFLAIISRMPKRNRVMLVAAAAWMLAMSWYDLFWLVMPVFHADHPGIVLTDVLCGAGVLAMVVAFAAAMARSVSLVPQRDPRLGESLAFENA